MSVLKAIILGIVQGVTEFLPVSSSGHLSLFHYLLGTTSDTSLLFDVMLHLGTLIAVFIVYYKTIWALVIEFFKLIKDIFTGKFKFKEIKKEKIKLKSGGKLADLAPTMLDLMNLEKPEEMTGESLIEK